MKAILAAIAIVLMAMALGPLDSTSANAAVGQHSVPAVVQVASASAQPAMSPVWVEYGTRCRDLGVDYTTVCISVQSDGVKFRSLIAIVRGIRGPVIKAWSGVWDLESPVYNLVKSDTLKATGLRLRVPSPRWDVGLDTCQARGWYKIHLSDGSVVQGKIRSHILQKFCGPGGG